MSEVSLAVLSLFAFAVGGGGWGVGVGVSGSHDDQYGNECSPCIIMTGDAQYVSGVCAFRTDKC